MARKQKKKKIGKSFKSVKKMVKRLNENLSVLKKYQSI